MTFNVSIFHASVLSRDKAACKFLGLCYHKSPLSLTVLSLKLANEPPCRFMVRSTPVSVRLPKESFRAQNISPLLQGETGAARGNKALNNSKTLLQNKNRFVEFFNNPRSGWTYPYPRRHKARPCLASALFSSSHR